MERPTGIEVRGFMMYFGAVILALGSIAFLFLGVMIGTGSEGGEPISAALTGMAVAGSCGLLFLAGLLDVWLWGCRTCATGCRMGRLIRLLQALCEDGARPPLLFLLRPVTFGPSCFLHEARIANPRSVLQREIDAPGGVDFGAAFSTHVYGRFIHGLGYYFTLH